MAEYISPLDTKITPVQEFFATPRGARPIKGAEEEQLKFGNVLSDILGKMNESELNDHASATQLATGNVNDLAAVLLDAEKADVYMRLTVQIRNKVVDAYNEVMRMSV